MSGRPSEQRQDAGTPGPSGAAAYAPGLDSNALEHAIQVRISGSLHVGCILSAKCKMPKGSRKARFKWQRLGRLGPRSKENLADGKTATYQIKPEDAGCWLRVACAPLLADGSVGPISSAISRKRISGTPILNAETLAFLESQPEVHEEPANAWDGPSAKQLKWMTLMDQTGASMAEVDISSEELAREQRLSQSSNNNNLGQGHKRNGSGSSNRSDTNGGATPRAQQHSQGASPRVPSSRDSFRDAEFFSPPIFIPKIPAMDIPFTPQTAHDGGLAAAAAAAAARGGLLSSPMPPFPSLAPAGEEDHGTPLPASWNRGQSAGQSADAGDSLALVPDRIPQTPIWASLTATELDRLFRDFTFAQREGFLRAAAGGAPMLDANGSPMPTRAEDIMRFAEENTKPGQTRAEALMSIASSVAKDAPPSVKRSDLLMELAETVSREIPPSPNRAQLLMQLFMAAEEAPTPYRA